MNKLIIWVGLLIAVSTLSFDTGMVTRVVDGDTLKIIINGQEETIRLLGVDTPESVHPFKPIEPGALAASEFTRRLVGRSVVLTYDTKRTDYYGRILAYIWVETGNGRLECWNVILIREGHSPLYNKYKFQGESWFWEVLE